MIIIKTPEEIKRIRQSGRLLAQVFREILKLVEPGRITGELDKSAFSLIKKLNAKPAFLNFGGYPKTICTSINEQVVHGIPGTYKLLEGDLLSVDIGILYDEYYADMAVTVGIGKQPQSNVKLIKVTREALHKGIQQMVPGNRLYDISSSIQEHVEKEGFSVVRDLVGHGIGRALHEDPQIPNFGKRGTGPKLEEGMVFAIEPMVNMGSHQVRTLNDNWTVVAADGKPSCHFEHTAVITKDGPEILTKE